MMKEVIMSAPVSEHRHLKVVLAACLLGALTLGGMPAQAAQQGGPIINSTVFRDQHVREVTAVTDVFGRSQRTTAAIIEYDTPLRNADVDAAL